MKERDQSVIRRLVIETEQSSLEDQILKSEENIEAISIRFVNGTGQIRDRKGRDQSRSGREGIGIKFGGKQD